MCIFCGYGDVEKHFGSSIFFQNRRSLALCMGVRCCGVVDKDRLCGGDTYRDGFVAGTRAGR